MDMKGLYIRNIVFGIADSLVSTVGLLAGIDASGSSRSTIILTGIIYAFVESLSMAVGSFLSEEAAEQYEQQRDLNTTGPFIAGCVMFGSFVISSFVPILPYVLTSTAYALPLSIGLSLCSLFIVGLVIAMISKVNLFKHALKMMLLGGAAILIGVAVGKYVHIQ